MLCTEQSMNPTGVSKVTKSTPFWYRRETVLLTVSIVSVYRRCDGVRVEDQMVRGGFRVVNTWYIKC